MKVFKTLVPIEDDGLLMVCDTIEYGGQLWLVPTWNGDGQPTRIIGLGGLSLERPHERYGADYLLSVRLSRATLDGSTAQGFVVIENPRITSR